MFARIEPGVSGLFSLTPGFSRVLKASNAEAVSTSFLQGKTVETVVLSIAA
jgi:hypothetical protein